MKKKGFTIVELLGIIIILGIILTIAIPLTNKIINNAEDESYNLLVSNLKGASEDYLADNMSLIPENEGDKIIITLEDLVNGNYLDPDVENPKTHKKISYTESTITITYINGSYDYNVSLIDEE